MKLATTAQMRTLEQAAVDAGATWSGLIEQAGWGVAQVALRRLGPVPGKRALVLAGPGNNGSDALVVARHLHDAGVRVTLYLWRRRAAPADANWQHCRMRDIAEFAADDDAGWAELRYALGAADLVVDGLLGMGISRPVERQLAEMIAIINHTARASIVLSIDMPTGVCSDTGAVLGAAVHADVTAATGLVKRGLLQYPGRAYAGEIILAEIGLEPEQVEALMSERIEPTWARALLPARPADAHKGTFGKVLVIAGSALYPGAASLASAAAARVGAGLVTLANGRGALAGPGRLPEVTLLPLPEADWNALGEPAADEALKHLGGYQALLVGPGLGREEPTRLFLERLLGIDAPKQRGQIGFRIGAALDRPSEKQRPELPPTVIDADALTLLSQIERWWEHLPPGRCVLTPHPGEMKRLLAVDSLDGDLAELAAQAAHSWGQIVVLKGATSVVAGPGGHTAIHDAGNPALATAGTGDVLAGAIAGLLAQGLAPFAAAGLGVYLHGAAGQLVRDDLGDMGALASDLLPRLPLAIKALKS
ncbi:MAG: NAD(P)H-hydrate dehydratase [Kouleothrix sp.]